MATPSYPLSLPSSPGFVSSTFELSSKTGITESPFTGKQQAHEFPYRLWRCTFTLPPMKRTDWNNWSVFVMQLRGRRGTFLLGDPDGQQLQGTATGTILTNGAANASATQIALDGFSNNGTIIKGDYIQIGADGANTLHLVTATATASGGSATVDFEPPLRAAVADNTAVKLTGAKAIFRMDSDILGWEANRTSNYGFTFSCTQAF